MPSAPKLTQETLSRDALQAKLQAIMDAHPECHDYRIDQLQVFAPGLIMGTNWRIAPPLDPSGERTRSPCWLAMLKEVQDLQRRYKLPWPP